MILKKNYLKWLSRRLLANSLSIAAVTKTIYAIYSELEKVSILSPKSSEELISLLEVLQSNLMFF